jgi:hypothetical protein
MLNREDGTRGHCMVSSLTIIFQKVAGDLTSPEIWHSSRRQKLEYLSSQQITHSNNSNWYQLPADAPPRAPRERTSSTGSTAHDLLSILSSCNRFKLRHRRGGAISEEMHGDI